MQCKKIVHGILQQGLQCVEIDVVRNFSPFSLILSL